jgi:hypothetical protein
VLEQMVLFDYDAAEIRDDARRTLDAKLPILRGDPTIRLRIDGHADERGSTEYNLALGNRRAAAVAGYLSGFGLDASRFSPVSYSEERPLASGANEAAWASEPARRVRDPRGRAAVRRLPLRIGLLQPSLAVPALRCLDRLRIARARRPRVPEVAHRGTGRGGPRHGALPADPLAVVLGYVIAGLIVGPHLPTPLVADTGIVQTLSELGVILLMFSLGLEFSLGTLAAVGPKAAVTAVIQSGIMAWLGFSTGQMLGWTTLESGFLGGAIAISSTTIIAGVARPKSVGIRPPLHPLGLRCTSSRWRCYDSSSPLSERRIDTLGTSTDFGHTTLRSPPPLKSRTSQPDHLMEGGINESSRSTWRAQRRSSRDSPSGRPASTSRCGKQTAGSSCTGTRSST